MYGLILESIADSIKRKYGNDTWNKIRTKAGITHLNFGRHLFSSLGTYFKNISYFTTPPSLVSWGNK